MGTVNRQNRNSSIPEALEAFNCVLQGDVGGARLVEKVTGDYHEIGLELDGLVNEFVEGVVKVLPSDFQTVLCIAKMQICGVDKAERLQAIRFPSIPLELVS